MIHVYVVVMRLATENVFRWICIINFKTEKYFAVSLQPVIEGLKRGSEPCNLVTTIKFVWK